MAINLVSLSQQAARKVLTSPSLALDGMAMASPDHDVSRRGGDVGPHRHLEDQTDHLLFFCHLSSPVANTTLTLPGRFAARAGLVTPRQTFVLRCHGDELHPAKVNPPGSSSDERVLQAPNWSQPGPTTLCPGWPH